MLYWLFHSYCLTQVEKIGVQCPNMGSLLGTQNALPTWNDLTLAGNVSHWYPYG